MDNKDKIILDLCGGTGAWSKPYKDAGYDVRLVTLPEQDVRLYTPPDNVYGILAAPPCTHFSFARTRAATRRDLAGGLSVAMGCLRVVALCQSKLKSQQQQLPPLRFWALENPVAMLQWYLGRAAFVLDPWEFGDNYSKRTGIWGYFNSPAKLSLSLSHWIVGLLRIPSLFGVMLCLVLSLRLALPGRSSRRIGEVMKKKKSRRPTKRCRFCRRGDEHMCRLIIGVTAGSVEIPMCDHCAVELAQTIKISIETKSEVRL